MTKTYYPFDAGAGANVTEDQWRQMARHWAQTGVLEGELNEFAVFADSSGMQVKVPSGRAWVRGHFFESDAQETLAIGAADATNPRIDRVVVRADFTANTVDLVVLEGTPAVTPTAPALTQSTSRWEVPLAQVAVAAAAATIAAGDVTDERTIVPSNAAYEALISRTGATAGEVATLQADNTLAFGPAAGGATEVIAETVLAASAASITFASIPATFRHLVVVIGGRASGVAALFVRYNGDTAANYDWAQADATSAGAGAGGGNADTSINIGAVANNNFGARLTIPNYLDTTSQRTLHGLSGESQGTGVGNHHVRTTFGRWRSTAALTQVSLLPSGGTFEAGTVATLYGMKGA